MRIGEELTLLVDWLTQMLQNSTVWVDALTSINQKRTCTALCTSPTSCVPPPSHFCVSNHHIVSLPLTPHLIEQASARCVLSWPRVPDSTAPHARSCPLHPFARRFKTDLPMRFCPEAAAAACVQLAAETLLSRNVCPGFHLQLPTADSLAPIATQPGQYPKPLGPAYQVTAEEVAGEGNAHISPALLWLVLLVL